MTIIVKINSTWLVMAFSQHLYTSYSELTLNDDLLSVLTFCLLNVFLGSWRMLSNNGPPFAHHCSNVHIPRQCCQQSLPERCLSLLFGFSIRIYFRYKLKSGFITSRVISLITLVTTTGKRYPRDVTTPRT